MSSLPGHADFEPCVGTQFQAHARGAAVALELISTRTLRVRETGDPGQSQPFSLLFRVLGDAPLPQGSYRMQHAGLGEFDLFLVPVARDRCEAVFS